MDNLPPIPYFGDPLPAVLLTACSPSFGDPNARPPTPQRTPTANFSSPTVRTPKQNSSHFDETSGWTPRFAEEYSVFNSTPGALRGTASGNGAFDLDFAPLSPVLPSTRKKRPLSGDGVALDFATHASHFAKNSATLGPVDAARQLPSSPDPLTLSHKDAAAAVSSNITPKVSQAQSQQEQQQQPGQRSAKKSRRASASATAAKSPSTQRHTQIATPPPSSRGGRKLAPKPPKDSMQNHSFPQPDFSSAPPPPPQLNTSFVTNNPEDVFGYPMGGPATAPPVTGPRPFWGFDIGTSAVDPNAMAIDVDLSASGADLFQTPTQSTPQRPMSSMEWGRANFQQTPSVARPDQQQQEQRQGQSVQQTQLSRSGRPLAPKTASMVSPDMNQPTDQNFTFSSFQMMDNPYNTSSGGVDPGLLFSQPTSSATVDSSAITMPISTSMDAPPQQPSSSAPATMSQTTANLHTERLAPTAPMPTNTELQRSNSGNRGRGHQRKQLDHAPAISPTKKPPSRPNLSRSFSESFRGGKRTVGGGRNTLPALAPARPVTVHQTSLPTPTASQSNNNRPQTQGGRSGGRSSPLKSSHHHRLSSLTSIPENASKIPGRSRSTKRASVKFVIDVNGRARTETIVDEDDDVDTEPDLASLGSSQHGLQRNSWGGSVSAPLPDQDFDEEYSSSSDDEPIIIPSRNTSFNFPNLPKSAGSGSSRSATADSIFAHSRPHTGPRHRSSSDRNPASSIRGSSQLELDTADSMDVDPPQHQPPYPPPRPSTGGNLGDAAAELRKVMQAGISRRPSSGPQTAPSLLGSGGSSGPRQRFTPGQRSSSSTISEASLPATSPPQCNEQGQVRCVCNRPEAGDGVFLVKW